MFFADIFELIFYLYTEDIILQFDHLNISHLKVCAFIHSFYVLVPFSPINFSLHTEKCNCGELLHLCS